MSTKSKFKGRVICTKAQFDALAQKDPDKEYLVTDDYGVQLKYSNIANTDINNEKEDSWTTEDADAAIAIRHTNTSTHAGLSISKNHVELSTTIANSGSDKTSNAKVVAAGELLTLTSQDTTGNSTDIIISPSNISIDAKVNETSSILNFPRKAGTLATIEDVENKLESKLSALAQSYEQTDTDNAVIIRNGNIVKQFVTFSMTGNTEKVWSYPYSYDADKKPMCWVNCVSEGTSASNGAAVIDWTTTSMTVRLSGIDSAVTFYVEGYKTN